MTPTQIGLTLAAISLGSIAAMWWLAVTAPFGWQDEDGFHEEFDDPDNWGGR